MLCEVDIIHINGFVTAIIETDRFISTAVARTLMVKVVSAYLLKLQTLEVYDLTIKFISQMEFGISVKAWHNF